MCGRFAQVIKHDQLVLLQKELRASLSSEQAEISFNVAPTHVIMAIVSKANLRYNGFFRWGLIPAWMKSIPKTPLINVRSESIHEKPSFKASFIRRRAIIPANGFYEWASPQKIPYYIYPADGSLLYMAGIYDVWEAGDGSYIPSIGIITKAADKFMQNLHQRMPLILAKQQIDLWLDPGLQDLDILKSLLVPLQDPALECHRVSTAVNKVTNNDESLVRKADFQEELIF
ncbi:MAG: SOS response-associated peptidase [Candidatus Cloacimonetes bacterium]|jgi:putative SOS response-associated peptidase YedK|nr:SOS response-associated peptidase [Candidatus Cloacimonadota bacterium]MDY0298765.1 SOS response-associated peptidase [Candidatus Cloacimonadaceae bacterium]